MTQLRLYDFPITKRAAARRGDPETSHEAAETVEKSGRASAQRAAVLEALRRFHAERGHGATSAELARYAGLDRHLVGRRLPDLAPDLVRRGPKRTCAAHGTQAMEWIPVT